MKICMFDGCINQQPKLTRGWCGKHYQRWRRNGDASKIKAQVSTPKPCDYCGKLFRPRRLEYATTCSGKCNLKRWRRDNPEHNQLTKMNWRRSRGVRPKSLMRGETHPQWMGGASRHFLYNQARRKRQLEAEGSHTSQEWAKLKSDADYTCVCCKRIEPEIKLTKDHVIPLINGGSNYISNIQPLCKLCNSRKHTKTIDYRLVQVA